MAKSEQRIKKQQNLLFFLWASLVTKQIGKQIYTKRNQNGTTKQNRNKLIQSTKIRKNANTWLIFSLFLHTLQREERGGVFFQIKLTLR